MDGSPTGYTGNLTTPIDNNNFLFTNKLGQAWSRNEPLTRHYKYDGYGMVCFNEWRENRYLSDGIESSGFYVVLEHISAYTHWKVIYNYNTGEDVSPFFSHIRKNAENEYQLRINGKIKYTCQIAPDGTLLTPLKTGKVVFNQHLSKESINNITGLYYKYPYYPEKTPVRRTLSKN